MLYIHAFIYMMHYKRQKYFHGNRNQIPRHESWGKGLTKKGHGKTRVMTNSAFSLCCWLCNLTKTKMKTKERESEEIV